MHHTRHVNIRLIEENSETSSWFGGSLLHDQLTALIMKFLFWSLKSSMFLRQLHITALEYILMQAASCPPMPLLSSSPSFIAPKAAGVSQDAARRPGPAEGRSTKTKKRHWRPFLSLPLLPPPPNVEKHTYETHGKMGAKGDRSRRNKGPKLV